MVDDASVREYSEVCTYLRFYTNLQFAYLTVFLALLASLAAFAFGLTATIPTPKGIQVLSKIGAIIAVFVFWSLEERTIAYWYHTRQRAITLEKQLGYQLHSTWPKLLVPFLSTTSAMRVLYLTVGIFWFYSLFV